MPTFNPPLLGDGHGNYKIQVVGNSVAWKESTYIGTGKSTLGTYLSEKLNIPNISLDKIAWKPGWQMSSADQLRGDVHTLLAQCKQGWIIDGDYGAKLGTLVSDTATDIIWLDPPLYHYLPRLIGRTFMRLLRLTPPCAEGCEETWEEVFSRKGIIWYCITNHVTARTKYTGRFSRMSVAAGGKMTRLDESCGELAKWKDALEHHIQQE